MQTIYLLTIKTDGTLVMEFKCRDDALDMLKSIFERADDSGNPILKAAIEVRPND